MARVPRLSSQSSILNCLTINKYLLFFVAYLVVYFVVGLAFYTQQEKWTFTEALYFLIVLTSTVGFGDYVPTSEGSKVFTVFAAFAGFGLFSLILSLRLRGIGSDEVNERMQRIVGHQIGQETISPRRRSLKYKLIVGSCAVLSLLAVGIIFSAVHLKYTFVDSLYLCVMAGTSVGFGDVSPSRINVNSTLPSATIGDNKSYGGMWFFIFYIVIFFTLVLYMLTLLSQWLVSREILIELSTISTHIEQNEVSSEILHALDKDNDGLITRDEWLAAMLVLNNVCTFEVVDAIFSKFDELRGDNEALPIGDAEKSLPADLHVPDEIKQEAYRRTSSARDSMVKRSSQNLPLEEAQLTHPNASTEF